MPLGTQYESWTAQCTSSVAAASSRAGVTLYRFLLRGSRPVEPVPVRQVSVPAPTAAMRYVHRGSLAATDPDRLLPRLRCLAPRGGGSQFEGRPIDPSSHLPVRPEDVVARPRQLRLLRVPQMAEDFSATFIGVGGGYSVPVPVYPITWSTPSHFASIGRLHFIGYSRSAAEFQGEGLILDVDMPNLSVAGLTPTEDNLYPDNIIPPAGSAGAVYSLQVLVFDFPIGPYGGLINVAHRIQQGLRETQCSDVSDLHTFLSPNATIGVVASTSSGASAGITLYGGVLSVVEA